jgi:hypothetical protein
MRVLVAAMVAVTLAVGAWPATATDKDAFAKRVGKYAAFAFDLGKPKRLCRCKDGFGSYTGSGEVGYVVQENYGSIISLNCIIPNFDTDGSFIDTYPCFVEWDMLGK